MKTHNDHLGVIKWKVIQTHLDVKGKVVQFQVLHEGSFDGPFLGDEGLSLLVEHDSVSELLLGVPVGVLDVQLGVPVATWLHDVALLRVPHTTVERAVWMRVRWGGVDGEGFSMQTIYWNGGR